MLACLVASFVSNSLSLWWPGSSVHGIFQARVLEWVAIAFSDINCIYMEFRMMVTMTLYARQ